MNQNFEILPIFPLPLYSGCIPNNYASLISVIDSQKILSKEDGVINTKHYGTRSENVQILNIPELKPLHDYILEQAKIYAIECLNLDYEEFKFSQSWISIKYQNQEHTLHSHSNSVISGVFYYGETDENTPKIAFQIPSNKQGNLVISPRLKNDVDPIYDPIFFDTPPGQIYIFPSSLGHFVPPNPSPIPRKSLAFNVVPKEGLGSDLTLNSLKF